MSSHLKPCSHTESLRCQRLSGLPYAPEFTVHAVQISEQNTNTSCTHASAECRWFPSWLWKWLLRGRSAWTALSLTPSCYPWDRRLIAGEGKRSYTSPLLAVHWEMSTTHLTASLGWSLNVIFILKNMVRAKSFRPGKEKGDVQLEQREHARCPCMGLMWARSLTVLIST